MNFDSLYIENGGSKVGVNPQGGYVTSWKKNGKDILYVGSVIKRSGMPVLFPYFGKSEKLRMHGFGRDSSWKLIEQSEHRVVMQLSNEDIDESARAEYGYRFVVKLGVELDGSGNLLYSMMVENTDEVPIPISPGLHPYWSIAHTEKSELVIEGIEGFDAKAINWEHLPPDNVYDFAGRVVVRLGSTELVIEDMSGVVKHVVVWSQTPVRDPDFDFVCIEPVCGDHYGIDRDPIYVEMGELWKMQVMFGVREL